MTRFFVPALAATALVAASAAFAADATGAIKSVDAKKHQVMLDNGQTYMFPTSVDLSKFKAGEHVKIVFATKQGKNEATTITRG
jgi:Cu/Ag efflux protein CusF